MGRTVVAALCLVAVPFALLSGCTQNFDQFTPTGAGGSGATGGTGAVGGQSDGGGSGAECISADDCDDSNVCTVDACSAGSCTHTSEPNGLAPGYIDQDGDCVEDRCDDGVFTANAADDAEVPNDNKACTTEVCSGGMIDTTFVAEGTDCGANPPSNLACDDMGNCVGCSVPSDCGVDTECITYTCDANMVCGFDATAAGTPTVGGQTSGDCRLVVCDGAGSTSSSEDNGDTPTDAGLCFTGACDAGTPEQNPKAPETACGGGNVCNATGGCVECFSTDIPCTPPETCGGGGTAEQCGCMDAGFCTGNNCGSLVDACGVTQNCTCAMGGDVCVSNVCCTPDPNPCMTLGWTCGDAPDGCSGTMNCGTCMAPTPTCNMGTCE